MIETKNDNKERYQSWEAEIRDDGADSMGHYSVNFTGYGETEHESKITNTENGLICKDYEHGLMDDPCNMHCDRLCCKPMKGL